MTVSDQAAKIAALNDLARTAMGIACRVIQTPGVLALPAAVQSKVRERVETYSEFDPRDNPYGERDFGAFDLAGERFIWKIDYYDRAMKYASPDPADLAQTVRVLTIMLAHEY